MAGDSFGATPAISNLFEDEPAVTAMNMMDVDADTFGNHNFDRGIPHTQRMVDLAEFPFVSANLKGVEENLTGVSKRVLFNVDGVRVAVIGITNEEAPELVFPGLVRDDPGHELGCRCEQGSQAGAGRRRSGRRHPHAQGDPRFRRRERLR